MVLHFVVGVGGGKGSVCPRITHLISQKVDFCIDGGDFFHIGVGILQS